MLLFATHELCDGSTGKRHTPSTFLLPCLDPRTIGAATQSNENDDVKKRTKTHGENERIDEMNSASDPSSGGARRRSTRVLLALPLIVRAVDALGRPFQDLALTETVNRHGCRYRAEHLTLKNTSVNLELPHDDKDGQPYIVRAKIVSVCPDGVSAFIFGVELEKAGNLWKIALPPADWFSFSASDDSFAEIPTIACFESMPELEEHSVVEQAYKSLDRAENVRAMPAISQTMPWYAREMAGSMNKSNLPLDTAMLKDPNEIEFDEKRPLIRLLNAQKEELLPANGGPIGAVAASVATSCLEEEIVNGESQSYAIDDWSERVQSLLEAAGQRTVARLYAAFEQELTLRLKRTIEMLDRLESQTHAAEDLLRTQQNRLAQVSEQAAEIAIERLAKIAGECESRLKEAAKTASDNGAKTPDASLPRLASPENHAGFLGVKEGEAVASKTSALIATCPHERRRDRRVKLSRPVLAQPSDRRFKEGLETTVNTSRDGLYFRTRAMHYYVGMHLGVNVGYAPHDPCNLSSFGNVVRIDRLQNGALGIAVRILLR